MKIGIAKGDFGISENRKISPVDPADGRSIIKGHKYVLADDYDLNSPGSLFDPEKPDKKGR